MSALKNDHGRVMVCPSCRAACREGSIYFERYKGDCDRCKVPLVEDADLARAARRRNLYVVRD